MSCGASGLDSANQEGLDKLKKNENDFYHKIIRNFELKLSIHVLIRRFFFKIKINLAISSIMADLSRLF